MTEKRAASFGPYTLDLRSGEFRKFGVRVKMGEQPFQILAMLLEKPGEMVSREELRTRLWPSDTFVDFDHGLNSAVQRLRDCLSDTAEKPQWVETVPRRGYRFLGKVEWTSGSRVETKTEVVTPAEIAVQTAAQAQEPAAATASRRGGVTWIAGVVAVGVLVTLWYSLSSRLRAKPAEPFQYFMTSQVTNNGKSIAAAISPDGKYLVYVVDDQGEQSVWLHHVPTNSDAQVIVPSKSYYLNLTFSRDGNFFYFRRAKAEDRTMYDLFRAPVLGGAPQRIVRNLDTGVSLTPDGSRMLYGRSNDPIGMFLILTADSDGTDEKAVWSEDNSKFPEFLTWSADAKQLLTLPLEGNKAADGSIEVRNAQTGKVDALIPSRGMYWFDLEWLPKERGLLLAYQRLPNIFRGAQIGFLSSLGGQLRQITNDTNNYQTMTLSADGQTIAAVQQKIRATLYFLPTAGFSGETPRPAPAQRSDAQLFSWTANGNVFFTEFGDLLEMSPDGRSKTTILHETNAAVMQMSVCPRGKYALVIWPGHEDATKIEVWRVNVDGSNPKRLTNSEHDVVVPACDPNGTFAYYDDPSNDRIMRVPLESESNDLVPSEPVPGTTIPNEIFFADEMSISPDGRWLAMMVIGADDPKGTIVLVPLDAGARPPRKMLRPDPRVSGNPRFTPDGKAVVYPVREKGVENLWLQPIDGGPGWQITNFVSDSIGNFQFSPDGKTLGVLEKHVESDVVLLKDTSGR